MSFKPTEKKPVYWRADYYAGGDNFVRLQSTDGDVFEAASSVSMALARNEACAAAGHPTSMPGEHVCLCGLRVPQPKCGEIVVRNPDSAT